MQKKKKLNFNNIISLQNQNVSLLNLIKKQKKHEKNIKDGNKRSFRKFTELALD